MEGNPAEKAVKAVLTNEDLLLSVLDFGDWSSRHTCLTVSRPMAAVLTSERAFQWRVHRLWVEHGIYYSQNVDCHDNDYWKRTFLDNWKRRSLWSTATTRNRRRRHHTVNNDASTFYIRVVARFKPRQPEQQSNNERKKIVLPLHQRLALIRMNRHLSSPQDALRVLQEQGGWFPGQDGSNAVTGSDQQNHHPVDLVGGVQHLDCTRGRAILVDRTKGLREFRFDHVMNGDLDTPQVAQAACYRKTAMPLVADFLNGYNATCLGYGPTGSGKTYTMFGAGNRPFQFPNDRNELPSSWGIVPRACHEILEALEYQKKQAQIDVVVSVSYIEIFGDAVNDLLNDGKPCGRNTASSQRFVLTGSSQQQISSFADVLQLLNKGEAQKRKAATAMNERSSRAHSIFILKLERKCAAANVSVTNRLFFADLGGSEQIKKSQPHAQVGTTRNVSRREREREAININLGLLALKQCVEALRKKLSHVPYGNSKLTMILAKGLGGDSKTAVIVCGAQEECHGHETISTMKFGRVCRGVYNSAAAGASTNMLQDLLQTIDRQISECEEHIRRIERWEIVNVEERDENSQVIAVRQKTRITGAEAHRERLAELIRRKMELTGDYIDSDLYAASSSDFGRDG